MCFLLYAGTTKPLPLKAWNPEAPGLSVVALSADEYPIRAHFGSPEVQYIGSTSRCGCDFPHLMFQGGGWPGSEMPHTEVERANVDELVSFLRQSNEGTVELYGVWNGDFSAPKMRDEVVLNDLLSPNFYFKEQGFYRVTAPDAKTRTI